ncbi:hypothetical protein ALP75_202553 [Pseudomonas syringae pv. actinidiae]|nr:hypothetical protein ALP75_202553 [Pseudomonas syringae pv. actinidiae]
MIETERRTDRQDPLAHFERVGITQPGGRQVLALDLQHGDIGARVGADQLGFQFAAVREAHENFVGTVDHMIVGQHIAIGRNDKARPQRLSLALAITLAGSWCARTWWHAALEKFAQHRRQAFQIRHLLVGDGAIRQFLTCTDVHYRRGGLLDQPGKVRQVFCLGCSDLAEHQHGGDQ